MSDISDILTVLAAQASAALYPTGTQNPSVTGADILVYPGWPASANLDQDLRSGKVHVSVFPKADERNTTRYEERCAVTRAPAPTLTLTMGVGSAGRIVLENGGELLLEDSSGGFAFEYQAAVVVGGAVSVPQNVMLRVSGKHYVYSVLQSDTLATVASALAALVAVDIPGTIGQGPVVFIGYGGRLQAARVGGFGTVTREVRRQERIVMIAVWAGTPALRDSVAAAIDVALADQRFLPMPDGYGARLVYKGSPLVDALQKALLYRRDLNYSVEFATTKSQQAAAVIAPEATVNSINITF